jgi:hypothetical protein
METPTPTTTKYLGKEGEDPTAPFWASGNYIGPYWSDGKLQESVEWGDRPVLNELDEIARKHDAAYAHFKDERHREAADMLFAEEAKKLKQKYGSKWADDPQMAARLVEYGNHTLRQVKDLAKIGTLGPAALPLLIYKQANNMIDNYKRMTGSYLKKELGDVKVFYTSDPRKLNPNATESPEKRSGRSEPTAQSVTGVSDGVGRGKLPETKVPASKRPDSSPVLSSDKITSKSNDNDNYQTLHGAALARIKPKRRKYHKRKLVAVKPNCKKKGCV